MSAATAQGRTTRARSKEVDSAPASPTKRTTRPRRGRSASVEQPEMDHAQNANMQLNTNQLATVTEEPEQATSENTIYHQYQLMPNALPNASTDCVPVFVSATADAVQGLINRRTAPKRGRGRPAASAPIAPMTSDQAQTIAQNAQNANQQMPALDPQLADPADMEQKRSLFDRQENAVRVPFDESQASQYQQAIQAQHDLGEVVATQDDGFQVDNRSMGSAPQQRRARAPRRGQQSSSSNYQPESSPQEERERTPRDTPPRSNYAEVQQQAKLFTAGLRRDKVPQKRKAWTSEECDALIDGIGRFGNGYATLKAEDNKHRAFLHDRSAEDLRHKARNMKFDYLKAGIPLPSGFDAVLLDKKFQDKLANMGREYTQTQMRQSKRQKTTRAVPQSTHEVDESSQAAQE